VREPPKLADRVQGVPDEVYEAAGHGDPLPLTTLRAHLHRCGDCQPSGVCATGRILVGVFESGRRYWGR
jgi:hypothetical protein